MGEQQKGERERQTHPDDELFGGSDVISSYTDAQAVADGILIPLRTARDADTRHRITAGAYAALSEHGGASPGTDLCAYVLHEILPLLPEAIRIYEQNVDGGILTLSYDFRKEKFRPGSRQLWLMPNEIGGLTCMLPEDY